MSIQDLATLYKEEIEQRIAVARTKLGEKGTEEEIKSILQELVLFENESRGQRNSQRREQLLQQAAGLRKELESLSEENRRKALLGRQNSARVDDSGTSSLLDGDEEAPEPDMDVARRSGQTLKSTKKKLNEIIDMGTDVSSNLKQQTDQMNKINRSLNQTQVHQGEARVLLRETEAAERRSKLIMYGAVCFVVVALIVGAYFILFG